MPLFGLSRGRWSSSCTCMMFVFFFKLIDCLRSYQWCAYVMVVSSIYAIQAATSLRRLRGKVLPLNYRLNALAFIQSIRYILCSMHRVSSSTLYRAIIITAYYFLIGVLRCVVYCIAFITQPATTTTTYKRQYIFSATGALIMYSCARGSDLWRRTRTR